ncbi:MAG: hypothetical protein ACLPXB_12405 [Thiobacillaceae bacterium]
MNASTTLILIGVSPPLPRGVVPPSGGGNRSLHRGIMYPYALFPTTLITTLKAAHSSLGTPLGAKDEGICQGIAGPTVSLSCQEHAVDGIFPGSETSMTGCAQTQYWAPEFVFNEESR